MKARLIATQAQIERFWAARNLRERLMLGAGAAVLICAAYILAVSSLQQRIASLQRKLPELLLSSYEIAGGSQAVPRAARSGDLRSELFKILADRGLQAELRALSTDKVEMRLPEQDAKTLISSLNAIRLAAGARVQSLQIRSTESAGGAGATAVLERTQ